MSIQEHLRPDEQVKMRFRHYYATDRRIIKHRESTFSEEMTDLDYDHITSIEVQRKTQWLIVLNGLLFLGLGMYMGSTDGTIADIDFFGSVMVLMWAGAFLTFFGLLYRTGHYHARGAGGEHMAICKHKYLKGLLEQQKHDAEAFIRIVRKLKKRRLNIAQDGTGHPNTTPIQAAAPATDADEDMTDTTEDTDVEQDGEAVDGREDQHFCTDCGGAVKIEHDYCPHCGEELDA